MPIYSSACIFVYEVIHESKLSALLVGRSLTSRKASSDLCLFLLNSSLFILFKGDRGSFLDCSQSGLQMSLIAPVKGTPSKEW